MSARHVGDLHIPLCGPDGEEVAYEHEEQANDPESQAKTYGGG